MALELGKHGSIAQIMRRTKSGLSDSQVGLFSIFFFALSLCLMLIKSMPILPYIGFAQAAAVLWQVASGLRFLHERLAAVHMDVKCENILLCQDGLVKLVSPAQTNKSNLSSSVDLLCLLFNCVLF